MLRYALAILMVGAHAATIIEAGQTPESGFLNRSVLVDGVPRRYQVYVPRDYVRATPWPLILALHGGGEHGVDGLIQTQVGLGTAIRRNADRFPAIVVFPQAPAGVAPGWQGEGARVALAALDAALSEFTVDRSRVYLTGLSMGGNGSWYLAFHHADRFAAAVIVCGWVRERRNPQGTTTYPGIGPATASDPYRVVAERIARLPIWIFHGDADTVVPVDDSRRMAGALKDAGAMVQYTELPGVGHNAWDPAYGREDVIAWLLAQRRRQ